MVAVIGKVSWSVGLNPWTCFSPSLIWSALHCVNNINSAKRETLLAPFWKNVGLNFQNYEASARTTSCTSKFVNSMSMNPSLSERSILTGGPNHTPGSFYPHVLNCQWLMLLQHYTFYSLIVSKARGKSGPLFNFDVHDDVRLLADATVEKNESHAGKVVERSWYNRNKHIFPASRWEVSVNARIVDILLLIFSCGDIWPREKLWQVYYRIVFGDSFFRNKTHLPKKRYVVSPGTPWLWQFNWIDTTFEPEAHILFLKDYAKLNH